MDFWHSCKTVISVISQGMHRHYENAWGKNRRLAMGIFMWHHRGFVYLKVFAQLHSFMRSMNKIPCMKYYQNCPDSDCCERNKLGKACEKKDRHMFWNQE